MPRWKRSDSVERAQLATSLRAAGPLQGWRAHIGLGLTLIAIEPVPANSRTSSYRLAHRGTGSGLSLVEVGEWPARGLMLAAQGAKVAQQHGRRWWPACTFRSCMKMIEYLAHFAQFQVRLGGHGRDLVQTFKCSRLFCVSALVLDP